MDGQELEEVRDHFHNSPGWLRDGRPEFWLGVSPLHHFLLGRLLQPLVECPEALSSAVGSVASQRVVLLCHNIPALVLVHDDCMFVGVLLQDADVRPHQFQQVQLLRESEVGGASFTHHTGQKRRGAWHLVA